MCEGQRERNRGGDESNAWVGHTYVSDRDVRVLSVRGECSEGVRACLSPCPKFPTPPPPGVAPARVCLSGRAGFFGGGQGCGQAGQGRTGQGEKQRAMHSSRRGAHGGEGEDLGRGDEYM